MTEAEMKEQYLREMYEAEMSEAEPQKDVVVDERHPDISFKDRALYKNFAVDPEQGFQFMQKKYPKHDFKSADSGDMLVKRKDENKWKKLDPSGFDLEDLSDIAYDVPAALFEGGATALGGIGGGVAGAPLGPVGMGVGALGGASAAGAGAGTMTEGVRQTLGKYFDVAQEYDPSQIGMSAGFGAAAPLMFGTGGAGKHLAKAALKKGISKEALQKAQSGLVMKGLSKTKEVVAPKVGSLMSGYTPETLKNLGKATKEKLFTVDPSDVSRQTVEELQTAFMDKKASIGLRYGEALENIDASVDVKTVEQPLFDLLEKYRTRMVDATEGLDEDAILKKAEYQDYIHLKDTIDSYANKEGVLTGAQIPQYLDKLNDITQIRKNVNVQGKSKVDQELVRVSKQVAGDVNKQLPDDFKGIKKEYAKSFEMGDQLDKYFKDPTKAQSTMQNLGSTKNFERKAAVQEIGDYLGVDTVDKANQMYILSEFFKPANASKYLQGATTRSRDIPLALGGGYAGYYLGQHTDTSPFLAAALGGAAGSRMGSPAMMRKFAEMDAFGKKAAEKVNEMGPLSPAYQAQVWQQLMQNQR